MAGGNFEAVMEEVFRHEGGLSMHRGDPGNWTGGRIGVGELRGTKYGIAAHAHPDLDIQNLTKEQARARYRRDYWAPIKGDDLPPGIDLVTMDPAVNSGVSRGVRWLQQALARVAVDGVVGDETLGAAQSTDPLPVIRRACAHRMGFLQGLRIWDTFGRGWSRRVASVEAVSVRMAVEAMGEPAAPALTEGEAGAEADITKDTTGAIAVGGGGTAAATFTDLPIWGLLGLGALVLVAVVLLIGKSRHDADRAEAYRREAERVKS